MVLASGGEQKREGGMERRMEGHVWHELCKQLLKYVCLWMCVCVSACVCMSVCVCTRGSRRLVNGTNGRGGPGKKEQACCYRGRTASLRRGLLHLGSCHTHTHTLCQTLVSPHPPRSQTHSVLPCRPRSKRTLLAKLFICKWSWQRLGRRKQDSFHLSHLCLRAYTHTHTQIFVCACICVWWVATMCVIYEVQRNRGTIKRVRCGESEDKDKEGPVWGSASLTPRIHLPQSANINITSLHFTCVSFFFFFFTDHT